jgi:hypothetical protein
MSPAAFYAATLREVDAVIDGFRWRQQQQYKALRYGAWHSALYRRVEPKDFPSIEKVMGWKAQPRPAQSPAEQQSALLAWKASCEARTARRTQALA